MAEKLLWGGFIVSGTIALDLLAILFLPTGPDRMTEVFIKGMGCFVITGMGVIGLVMLFNHTSDESSPRKRQSDLPSHVFYD